MYRGSDEARSSPHSGVEPIHNEIMYGNNKTSPTLSHSVTQLHTYTHTFLTSKMSGPGVGFQYPAVEVTWLKRDVLLFANSIGATADELHFLYVCSSLPSL